MLRRAYLLPGILALLIGTSAAAAERYRFASDDALRDASRTIVTSLTEYLQPRTPCVIQVVLQPAGLAVLAEADLRAFGGALVEAFGRTGYGRACRQRLHDLTAADRPAADLAGLLPLLRAEAPESIVALLEFYRTGAGLMLFARLQDLDGGFVASSGRVDLPVATRAKPGPALPVAAAKPAAPVAEAPPAEPAPTAPAPPAPAVPAAADPPPEAPPASAEAGADEDAGDVLAGLAALDGASEGPDGVAALPPARAILRLNGSALLAGALAPDLARGFLRAGAGGFAKTRPEVIELAAADKPRERRLRLAAAAGQPAELEIEIYQSDSTDGLAALLAGDADLALTARPITDDEAAAFLARHGVDMRSAAAEHVVALDALEILVGPDNRLPYVSRGTLAQIYGEGLTEWELGALRRSGVVGPIRSLGLANGGAGDDGFAELVMAGRGLRPAERFAGAAELVEALATDSRSIGYASLSLAADARPVDLLECGLVLPADAFLVGAEDYPLTRRLYLYANPALAHPARDALLAYALSTAPGEGQTIVDGRFVGLGLRTADDDLNLWRWQAVGDQPTEQPEMRARYREAIADARRLSATFRFRTGADLRLDSRGERDLAALAAMLAETGIAPERLLLFGFADAQGESENNLRLSTRRARMIAALLAEQGIAVPRANTQGIGEEAPIACNFHPDGRPDLAGQARNRRVEVWLRAGD
jgi:phosphate transport system substrate-binding protein